MIELIKLIHKIKSSNIMATASSDDLPIFLKLPNEKLLEKMIEEEEDVRTSKDYQDKCTAVKHIPNGWLDVTAQLQIEIVKRNGFDDQMSCDVACNMLRRAHLLYPDNEKFKKLPLYVRNNKAKQGTLKVKDNMPNISLNDLDGSSHDLFDLVSPDKKEIKKTIMISATGT